MNKKIEIYKSSCYRINVFRFNNHWPTFPNLNGNFVFIKTILRASFEGATCIVTQRSLKEALRDNSCNAYAGDLLLQINS